MTNKIVDFIFEIGSARRIKRSHIQFIGTSDESISDHSYRVIWIAMIIANIEKANVNKVLMMALLHDLPEIRTGDLNPLNGIYTIDNERKAFSDQIEDIPGNITLKEMFNEYSEKNSIESIIVKDADLIDQLALQKEYYDRGVNFVNKWNKYQLSKLRLNSSKEIAKKLIERDSNEWLQEVLSLYDKY